MPFGQKRGRTKSNLFDLMYDGYCPSCGEWMEAGDQGGYVDDELICKSCWEEHP